jgi:M6 family metalloprotease-like protein
MEHDEFSCRHGHHNDKRCHCCCHDGGLPRLSLKDIAPRLPEYMVDEYKQEQFLSLYPVKDCRPHIVEFSPWSAVPSSLMVIIGHGFEPRRELNTVTVGGCKTLVVTAECHRLVIICSFHVKSGPVCVETNDGKATGPRDFKVLSWPRPTPEVDGPPYSFEGVGDGTAVDLRTRLSSSLQATHLSMTVPALNVPKVGMAKVLCIAGYPRDFPPADLAAAMAAVKSKATSVTTYYKQASYKQLDVNIDVIGFFKMANKRSRYYKATPVVDGYPNFDQAALPQIWAECADYAKNKKSRDLNTYDVLMIVMHMEIFVRAWGGGTAGPNISFSQAAGTDQDALSIDITLTKALGQMTLGDDADWGRFAHEFGHNIVPPAAVLPEDIYASGQPASDATGTEFDLMGSHDSHPLFSGYNIDGLGWFSPSNVRVYQWSTAPFSQEVDIVAHGLNQNTDPIKCHLVRIQVSTGLEYYIEVRQRPGATAQIFDPTIPVPAGRDGGVVVTRSINGTVNNNQFIRLITLLQASPTTLTTGQVAVDPLRTILITVTNDKVQANPRVCRVKIEWAQPTMPTPKGTFDIWIKPWGPDYTTPDIWIDRQPYYPADPYDHHDPSGNPTSGGDAPRVGEINHFRARIRNSGTSGASNVVTSFYVNTPPGIGDSGNWTPLRTVSLAVPAGGDVVATTEWDPSVGEHTCLQVAIVPQTGEVSISNNKAQENVFTFLPASHSVPEPVELPVAVRNPLNKRTLVWITLDGVPEGFYVYFPRRWLYLEALSERTLELLVIPLRDIKDLKTKIANVRVQGYLPWPYNTPQPVSNLPPGSTARLIGGIQTIVAPKVGSKITLQPDPGADGNAVTILGGVTPPTAGQIVRVDMSFVDSSRTAYRSVETNANGGFSATFSFSVEGPTVVEVAFQAHIINATILAPADSNIVHYTAKVNVPRVPEGPK